MNYIDVILPYVLEIVCSIVLALIGIFGAWLTNKLAKSQNFKNITAATAALIESAEITVGELQQQFVADWKVANADGKLTDDEKAQLKDMLLIKTKDKMSASMLGLLDGAMVDVNEIITGAAENYISVIKTQNAVK